MAIDWAWLAMVAGFPALRSCARNDFRPRFPDGPSLPMPEAMKPRKCVEIEAKTDAGNRKQPRKSRPEIDAVTAIDTFIREWAEIEPGAELAFAEIHATYTRKIAGARGWPDVSQVLMSKRLQAAGAKRTQKRLSATDKPIFYTLPDLSGAAEEGAPMREEAA